ncbi:hypothetical protein E1B28_002821 [Marasmius oreades]|uniref:DUF7330 domain-containing protein n=1 Tax=Marasmius oreades TaxID=181124 RepID=A0A9P7RPD6_9AGAR|nr:uncharacterized protein E1B28_002821 [Marasmius oreades]KAG7086903.1 hypothetical protein E1B28_002821 [Marasmius oreades]
MIIQNEEDMHDKAQAPNLTVIQRHEEAPPPQYEEYEFSTYRPNRTTGTSSAPRWSTSSSSFSSSTPGPVPADSRAVNYISINKPLGSIDCTYLLDPTIHIPSSLLPKLEPGQTEDDRKNLSLKTKLGTIVANIHLLHREGSVSTTKRTTLECKTTLGTMVVKIDATPSKTRPPFHLKAQTQSGTIDLQLPRSFRGFLTITTTIGTVTLSPEVHQANRWIHTGSAGRVRRGFLGDSSSLDDVGLASGSWNGDEVVIETAMGSVDVSFVGGIPSGAYGFSGIPPRTTTSSSWHSSSYSSSSSSWSWSTSYRGGASASSPQGFPPSSGAGAQTGSSTGPPPLAALLGYRDHK